MNKYQLVLPDGTVEDSAEADELKMARSLFWHGWYQRYYVQGGKPKCRFFEAEIKQVEE